MDFTSRAVWIHMYSFLCPIFTVSNWYCVRLQPPCNCFLLCPIRTVKTRFWTGNGVSDDHAGKSLRNTRFHCNSFFTRFRIRRFPCVVAASPLTSAFSLNFSPHSDSDEFLTPWTSLFVAPVHRSLPATQELAYSHLNHISTCFVSSPAALYYTYY